MNVMCTCMTWGLVSNFPPKPLHCMSLQRILPASRTEERGTEKLLHKAGANHDDLNKVSVPFYGSGIS